MKQLLIMISTLLLGLGLLSGQAHAASCKGQSQNSCAASSSCSWVKGYKKKDGTKVNAYCRGKAGKAAKAKASDKKAAAKSKAEAKKAAGKSKASDKKAAAKAKADSKKAKAKKDSKKAKAKAKKKAAKEKAR